jgi:low affinity Fe/Cu permease
MALFSKHRFGKAIEKLSLKVTALAGSSGAIVLACMIVIGWLVTGPIFKFSTTWLICIDSFTAVITFLMVFLIQRSQNKDSLVVQIKLNEILASTQMASNRIMSIEDMTEDELKAVNKYYSRLSDMARAKNGGDKEHRRSQVREELKSKVLNKEKPIGNNRKKAPHPGQHPQHFK